VSIELEAFLGEHWRGPLERPPLLWRPRTESAPLAALIAAIAGTPQAPGLKLNVSNVVIDHDEGPAPRGEYVALTVSGSAPLPALEGLRGQLEAARARHAYVREAATVASLTAFFERAG
jgi:hypothetical protein